MSDAPLGTEEQVRFGSLTVRIDFQDELEINIDADDCEHSRWLNKTEGLELLKLLNKWLGT